jgi:type 1 glutamine amidotransferase
MNKTWFATLVLCLAMTAFAEDAKPIKVLIITGDHGYHDWKTTTAFLKTLLDGAGMKVDVTETPAKDLNPDNLAKYDALLLNYRDMKGPPETRWSDENKKAFKEAVAGGKGLLVYHFASSAFVTGDDWSKEYEKIIAGGWRKQGFHGKRHEFDVTIQKKDHPITRDMPDKFAHSNDELYQNSLMFPESEVLATAWSDKKKDPKNTDKDEPMVWVAKYGQGRVCENVMGHDVPAMQDLGFQTLLIRGVEWVATGDVKTPVPEALKKESATK